MGGVLHSSYRQMNSDQWPPVAIWDLYSGSNVIAIYKSLALSTLIKAKRLLEAGNNEEAEEWLRAATANTHQMTADMDMLGRCKAL